MDIDELIRTELTAQAERAPDPHTVLAGVPARARARRTRRIAVTAAAAAAVVLATAVPYAALHRDRAAITPAAAPRQSVALDWEPGWAPPELTETNREVGPGHVGGRFTDYSRGITQGVDWQVGGDNLVLPESANRVPVTVGPYQGFWDTNLSEDGMARLYFEVSPGAWAFVGVTDWTPDPKAVALRVGASLHHGDRLVDLPVRFDRLPAGMTEQPWVNAGSTGSADAWAVRWSVTGAAGSVGVTVFRGTQARYAYPGIDELGTEVSRTPVAVGGRPGSWVTYRVESSRVTAEGRTPIVTDGTTRILEVPLDDGVVLRLTPAGTPDAGDGPSVPDADLVRMAAGAVQLPVDYSWLGR